MNSGEKKDQKKQKQVLYSLRDIETIDSELYSAHIINT